MTKCTQWTALAALMLGVPVVCAAQTSQTSGTPPAQTGTSIITPDPESHWMASGFAGSNFGNNAEPSSGAFGGSIGYLWNSKYGAEFDTGFAPNFELQSRFFGLGITPQINTYMANAIAAFPLGADAKWQPYVSGGGGAISLLSGTDGEAANFLNPNDTKFGGNVGGGVMGFAGNWGFKADVRYYRAAGAYQTSVASVTPSPSAPSSPTSPSPAPAPGPYAMPGAATAAQVGSEAVTSKELVDSALSGLAFWRSNFGIAFGW